MQTYTIELSAEQIAIIVEALKSAKPAKDTEAEILIAMFEDMPSDAPANSIHSFVS